MSERDQTIQAEIAASITAILPELGQQVAKNVARKLVDMGITSKDRLRLVKEGDLEGSMLTFQARLLIEAWRKEKEVQQPPNQNLQNPHRQDEWDFHINWTEIYAINTKIKKKLGEGKKLTRREKVELVKRLVNQVRQRVPHATRRIFIDVTKQLKRKYPVTFSSELAQGKINRKSLGKRMMDKYDNDKRPKRKTAVEVEAPAIKAAYGCVKWRLATLPDGETEETQNEKQGGLVDHFEERRQNAWDWDYIYANMDNTYGTLRKEINKQAEEIERLLKLQKKNKKKNDAENENVDDPEILTTTEQLRNRWPFLFQPACMLRHFQKLTGIDLSEKFDKYLKDDMEQMLEFLFETTKKTKKIKKRWTNAKTQPDNADIANVAALLLLLLKRFEENCDSVWKIVDSYAREEDIPNECQIPKAPCLIIAGGDNIFKAENIYFTMDETVLGTAEDLVLGVKLLFASYYVFNIEYASEAQVTLEFIQRCVADIDPPRGNKRPKVKEGHSSDRRIHPRLQSLNDKFDDFFAEKEEEEESDSED